MATKMQKLIELSQDIFKELPSYNSWTNFLATAAWHYKYPFPDQAMIYKQRPDAKACASIDVWNNTLHRWVNKGTKGIALIHNKNGKPYIDYVFDISDTNSFYGNEVKLWEYNEKYNDAIIETLENTFGELSSKHSIVDAVISAAHNAVEDNKADYLSSLKYAKENSFLENLDELNIDVEFQQTAENSVAFMVLERLGYDAFEFFDNEDFPHIVDFNTTQTMHILGGIVSSIAEQTLREVAETVRAEVKKERTAPKFFAENNKSDYNIDREENSLNSNERTDENDRVDLQTRGRLSDTEHRTAGEQTDRQIRDAEGNILEEGTELPVQHNADGRNIERASLGDRPNSEATGKTDGTENGTDGEHQRGTESKRPDDVDRTNEQPFTFRRRSHTPTANLQLSLFPLLEEQQDIIREAEQATFGSAFSISQQIIDEVITSGSNRESTAINICIEYSKNKSLDDKVAFLRKEFEVGGKGFVFDDKNISAWWNYDGIYISQGNTATTYDEHLTWEQLSNRIDELLELGRFASPEVISSFIDIEKDRVAKYLFEVIGNINHYDYPVLKDIFKEEVYQGNYDDAVAKIKASLENPQQIQHHISLLNILETAKNNHDEVMRFRFYQPDISISQLQDMLLPRKVFATELEAAPMPQRFITEDEINKIVCRGSNKTDGKYRIYDFFTKNTDKKARREFLDKEFGWGSSHGFTYEIDHDKKGLVISRRDILSPFAKVTMKFSEMEKRIDDLINTNAYLTEHEKNVGYPDWLERERQEQAAIQSHSEQDEYLMSFSRNRETVNLSNFPKRLHTLVQYCKDDYEGRLISENGFDNLFEMTELDIPALLLNDDTRDKLQKCLRTVGGSTGDVTIRNSSYIMSDELLQYRKIDLHRLGDFYEAYGEDAKLVAEVLELTLTSRTIDGERVDMVGFPQHTLEKYAAKLQESNIIVNYADRETPILTKPVEAVEETAPETLPELDSKIQDVHNDFKAKNPDYVIFVLNDEHHYEVYGEDAKKVADILGTTLEQITVAGFTETSIDMTQLLPPNQTEEFIDSLKAAGQNVILVGNINDEYVERGRYACKEKVQEIIANMSDEEKEKHIGWIELKLDYSEHNFSDEDYEVYAALITERAKAEEKSDDLSQYVGMELKVDDRKFVIDSINTDFDSVSLKDITFQNGTGFPIFRRESIEWLKYVLEKQEQKPVQEVDEALVPDIVTSKSKTNLTPLYPEITGERKNFVITDNELGYGTASEKFNANVTAIRTLKTLESEHRLATPEEQEILSRYVGWGGLADCFDEKHSKYQELKSLLTEEEFTQARASTLNAHYTSPTVIKAMYKALENMGFKQGNILEPSCGIGNFMGLLPDSMNESKMYGIEIDSLTGRIAQRLYPNNSVTIQGFEDATLPDSFFDVAIGNVPFGNYKLPDKKYDKHNFFIHDYFFAKTLDKVRPGGIVAFITSMGTMDKKNSAVRKYIAQRADLIGAIRLPNDAFYKNAGTQVTADIIFLQKRDRQTDIMPDWVNLGTLENGLTVNQYFVDNPDMILGEMTEESSQYGKSLTCKPYEDADLAEQLEDAIQSVHAQITEYEFEDISDDEDLTIPADPDVKNFSYTLVDGEIYFRENSIMKRVELNATAENRIKGLIEIRDVVRELIEYQTLGYPDWDIKKQQDKLNKVYDDFTKKYGLINSRGNSLAFSEDSSYFLLCSLEVMGENGELERKADIFTKRTIGAKKEVTKVDTSSEALAVSMGEKAKIDMEFMSELTGKTEEQIYEDLKGVIFLNPMHGYGDSWEEKYVTADEYLSGNVKTKLEWARKSAEQFPEDYAVNVEALEKVQPEPLSAADISVKLGSTWIPDKYIEQFTYELLDTPIYARREVKVRYYKPTAEWNVSKKSFDRGNVKANNTYGTHRANAYKIIEETLNQRDVRIFDYVENENGTKTPVLNAKETAIAQQKQETIKQAFLDWVWKDPTRREELVKLYNDKFNSTRPREYDGSHITFIGINPEIELRQHQKNAVARVMYGGNALIGHEVGAGKTWTMVAAAMESKRLGLCNKSLFVVPNHLTEQWASEFLQLYPAANILVATKKDFETKNRKKFCGRIATGDYDAVIIGHSQFEKIPMSVERQVTILQREINEIMMGIAEAKASRAENFTIKQMEKARRNLEAKLAKLNDQSRKDDVVTFEELGVDRVFVDEAHYYKNLFLYTKMRNVGGISQTEAQKSSDMYMKSRYLDELTGGKGLIFATGTPVSNSMVELYTMQRYLQYGALAERDLQHFDAWASTYGETVTAIELAPEGTGYRAKTRFAKFFNLPELMNIFKEVADIQTADTLNLPVPEAIYHNVATERTEIQKEFVENCGERAEKVRDGNVDPHIDNMLKITNDGRKIALDQRLENDLLPDDETSKVNECFRNVYKIWDENRDEKLTQIVFCDMSTPKPDGTFDVYNDIKDKLIQQGVPESEIAFIHDAETEARKKELFAKVRKGDVRILFGSTFKMGTGTNVQKKLVAMHDLDCPWRPSDLKQRSGRIVRQGNQNEQVHIFRYVTKDTFDSYMWQTVENKQKFISQIMTSKSPVRAAEDIDETALSYAEIKALSAGNPYIKEKMELDTEVAKLKMVKSSFQNEKYDLEDKVLKYYPNRIAFLTQTIQALKADTEVVKQHPKVEDAFNPLTIDGVTYTDKKQAGEALIERCKKLTSVDDVHIGEYRGFQLYAKIYTISKSINIEIKNELSYSIEVGADTFGNIQKLDNVLARIEPRIEENELALEETKKQFEVAKVESQKEFPQEAELKEKLERLATLDALLNMDKKGNDKVIMGEPDEAELPQRSKQREMVR